MPGLISIQARRQSCLDRQALSPFLLHFWFSSRFHSLLGLRSRPNPRGMKNKNNQTNKNNSSKLKANDQEPSRGLETPGPNQASPGASEGSGPLRHGGPAPWGPGFGVFCRLGRRISAVV